MLFRILLLLIINFSLIFSQIKEVTILHWNDFHARNVPYKVTKKDSTGKEISYLVGGAASMLGYVKKYRTENTIVLNGGDDFQGSPISSITKGGSQIELLNLYDLDAFVLGNHEFDYSQESLDSVLKLANFDYLSANTFHKDKNKTFGKPNIIIDINGVKIGVIGITTPELYEVSLPKNVDKIVLLDMDSVITENIKVLKNEKCDVITLLSHCGVEYDRLTAEKFYTDIDLIVGGHSHTPLFKPEIVNGVIIVQAGSNSRYLGKLDLKIDTDKDTIINKWEKLIETIMDSNVVDKEAQKKVEDMLAYIAPEMNKVIGKLETDWTIKRNEEGNLGHFQADAFKKGTKADVAFVNGSGLRKTLQAGDIKVTDIWEINPFGNEVMIAVVKGKTLKQMMTNFLKMRINEMDKGSGVDMIQAAGLYIEYDGSRKDNDEFIKVFKINNETLNEEKDYTIATNSFIANQLPKFFGELDYKLDFKYTGYVDRDMIINEVNEMKVINTEFKARLIDVSGKY